MTIEDRLQTHLDGSARRLPPAPDNLEAVVARGRRRKRAEWGAVALAVVALAVAVPAALGALRGPAVDFAETDPEPGAPDMAPTQEPDPTPPSSPEPSPDPSPTDPQDSAASSDAEPVELTDLGARVIAYGPYEHDFPFLVDAPDTGPGEARRLYPGVTDVVLADGAGGVVVQDSQAAITWVPYANPDQSVTLVSAEDVDGQLLLRAIDPEGRAVYSIRPRDEELMGEPEVGDDAEEHFFVVALADGAEPELIGSRLAYEAWHVGPAWVDAGPVHASCHLLCALRAGAVDSEDDSEAIYDGHTAIEGLTATPDGRILGFVERDETFDAEPADLVLLDGASFEELARVPMTSEPEAMGAATVSLSADGQRVLVGLGRVGPAPLPPVPTSAYLVENALSDAWSVHPIDFEGAVRWLDPSEAVALSGEPTQEDRDLAEALRAFGRAPSAETHAAVPFADEVALGLGPHLRTSVSAATLEDPATWELDGPGQDGLWRAAVGPFSALSVLDTAVDHEVAVGPHPHCASPPVPAPDAVSGLRRVSLQPVQMDSCLGWWTVDAFVEADGRVAAVTMDFYEP